MQRLFKWAVPVLALLITLMAGPAWANPPQPQLPDGFPECRRTMDGEWFYVGPDSEAYAKGHKVHIKENDIWWSYHDQSSSISFVDEQDTRRLYRFDPPIWDYWGDQPEAMINYILFENPMGKLGLLLGEKIWPCAVTVSFCYRKIRANEILENDFGLEVNGTDQCIHNVYVPYSLTWE